MAAERQVPGGGYVNEVGTAQRQIPDGPFVNETVSVGGGGGTFIPIVGRGPGMALAGPGGLAGNNMGAHR